MIVVRDKEKTLRYKQTELGSSHIDRRVPMSQENRKEKVRDKIYEARLTHLDRLWQGSRAAKQLRLPVRHA